MAGMDRRIERLEEKMGEDLVPPPPPVSPDRAAAIDELAAAKQLRRPAPAWVLEVLGEDEIPATIEVEEQ